MNKISLYRLIDTAGQVTAIITDPTKLSQRAKLAQSIMTNNPLVEQVGFLDGVNFTMMGGELSINGLLAGAFVIGQSGKINNLNFNLNENIITLTLPKSIVVTVEKNIIQLRGITYSVEKGIPTTNTISPQTKQALQKLTLDSPAAGIIYYEGARIKPLIYVQQTNSYKWENACGSGSLAFALFSSLRNIIQPSGQTINYQISKNSITVTVTAKEL